MFWLVLLGAALMDLGILLLLLQRKIAGQAAREARRPAPRPTQADPRPAVDPAPPTTPLMRVEPLYVMDEHASVETVPTGFSLDVRRPIGAIPAGWCAPPPLAYSADRARSAG